MRRMLALITDALLTLVVVGSWVLLTVVLLVRGGVIHLNMSSMQMSVAIFVLGTVLWGWIWFNVYLISKYGGTLGGYIWGLTLKAKDTKDLIIRLGVGLILDIILLPVNLVLIILDKRTIAERWLNIDVAKTRPKWTGITLLVIVLLFFGYATISVYRSPQRLARLIIGTPLHAQLIQQSVTNQNIKLAVMLQDLGLSSPALECFVTWQQASQILDVCLQLDSEPMQVRLGVYRAILVGTQYNPQIVMRISQEYLDILQDTPELVSETDFTIYTILLSRFETQEDIRRIANNLADLLITRIEHSNELAPWFSSFLEGLLETDPKTAYQVLLELDKRFEEAWIKFLLGEYFYKEGNKKEAKKYFDKAVQLDEEYAEKVAAFKL